VKVALDRIRENDVTLGHHLATTIKTGTFCSYVPEPGSPLAWKVSSHPYIRRRPSPGAREASGNPAEGVTPRSPT
jgi:hypothetical protein